MANLRIFEYENTKIRKDHGVDTEYYVLQDGNNILEFSPMSINSIMQKLKCTNSDYYTLFKGFVKSLLSKDKNHNFNLKDTIKAGKLVPSRIFKANEYKKILNNWNQNAINLFSDLMSSCPSTLFHADVDDEKIAKALNEILDNYGKNSNIEKEDVQIEK